MTNADMVKVVAISATADGSCHVCAGQLIAQLRQTFPNVDWPIVAQSRDNADNYTRDEWRALVLGIEHD